MDFQKKMNKALDHIENEDYKNVISVLEELKKGCPEEVSVRNLLGITYFKLGKYKLAYKEFSCAVRLDVDNLELQSNLDAAMYAIIEETESNRASHKESVTCSKDDVLLL